MNNNNNIGWFFRLITDNIALAKQNTALVFDSCSIFLGSGDIVCYQPQTIQYYINILNGHDGGGVLSGKVGTGMCGPDRVLFRPLSFTNWHPFFI